MKIQADKITLTVTNIELRDIYEALIMTSDRREITSEYGARVENLIADIVQSCLPLIGTKSSLRS